MEDIRAQLNELEAIKRDHLDAVDTLRNISKGRGSCSTSVMATKHLKEALTLELIRRLLEGIRTKTTFEMASCLIRPLGENTKLVHWMQLLNNDIYENQSVLSYLESHPETSMASLRGLLSQYKMTIEDGIIREVE